MLPMKLKLIHISVLIAAMNLPIHGQSLESVIEKHYEAHNQQFWDQINTLTAKIEWNSTLGYFGGEIWAKKPDKIMVRSQKHRFIEAFDGRESWTIASWTDEEVASMNETRSFMIREIVYYGTPVGDLDKLNFKGEVEVDQIPCFWIEKITNTRRDEFFIDAKTYLLYKSLVTQRFGDKTITLTRTVNKYREFNKLKVPTVIELKTWELTSEYVLDDIVLGEGIPSSKFTKPND